MRVGIFGGTFDPPHWGHLLLAEFVRDEAGLDQVWLVPALQPPHKTNYPVTDAATRYRMVELACAGDAKIVPSDADITHNRRPSFTIDLIDDLQRKFPQHEFALIIGGDSLVEITTWHRWQQLLRKCQVIVLPRPGFDLTRAHPDALKASQVIESPLVDISSTAIRQRVREGKSIRYMVPEAVRLFIEREGLYRR